MDEMKLIDIKKFEFGSVAYQNAMMHNILEKELRNIPLVPEEYVFLDVQSGHDEITEKARVQKILKKSALVDRKVLEEAEKTELKLYKVEVFILGYNQDDAVERILGNDFDEEDIQGVSEVEE